MKTVTYSVDINAHITNIVCDIEANSNASKASISFNNLGFGVITAVKFNAQGFNSFGDVVQVDGKNKFYLIVQDINIDKNTSAKNLKAILLIPTFDDWNWKSVKYALLMVLFRVI